MIAVSRDPFFVQKIRNAHAVGQTLPVGESYHRKKAIFGLYAEHDSNKSISNQRATGRRGLECCPGNQSNLWLVLKRRSWCVMAVISVAKKRCCHRCDESQRCSGATRTISQLLEDICDGLCYWKLSRTEVVDWAVVELQIAIRLSSAFLLYVAIIIFVICIRISVYRYGNSSQPPSFHQLQCLKQTEQFYLSTCSCVNGMLMADWLDICARQIKRKFTPLWKKLPLRCFYFVRVMCRCA